MNIAIVGSRKWVDPNPIEAVCRAASVYDLHGSTIVSGGARGPDSMAETYAQKWQVDYLVLLAKWQRQGNQAGFIRNLRIVQHADIMFAFWDGKSAGTRHSFGQMHKAGKPVVVVSPVGTSEPLHSLVIRPLGHALQFAVNKQAEQGIHPWKFIDTWLEMYL